MPFTPPTYGVVVFPCVWMLCMCSVLTPVFIMYRGGGGRMGEGVCTVVLCQFRVMLRIWGCVYQCDSSICRLSPLISFFFYVFH
jgi:hypothetical protein